MDAYDFMEYHSPVYPWNNNSPPVASLTSNDIQFPSDLRSPMDPSLQSPVYPGHHKKIPTISGIQCLWETSGRICQEWYQNPEELADHIDQVHIPREKIVVCYWKECGRVGKLFDARYRLVNHLRVHTGETPFQCKVCRKEFARNDNLKLHERYHTGEKPFLCSVEGCSKRYSNSSDRITHMKEHMGYRFECKQCDRKYIHRRSLRRHIKENHSKESSGKSGSGTLPINTSAVRRTSVSEYHYLANAPSYLQVEHAEFYDYPYSIHGYYPI